MLARLLWCFIYLKEYKVLWNCSEIHNLYFHRNIYLKHWYSNKPNGGDDDDDGWNKIRFNRFKVWIFLTHKDVKYNNIFNCYNFSDHFLTLTAKNYFYLFYNMANYTMKSRGSVVDRYLIHLCRVPRSNHVPIGI